MKASNSAGRPSALFTGLSLLVVLATLVVLLTRELGNPHLGYPDADRILMDGVFIHDFLRDLPLTHIYDYTINYYGQYPALSIGYRPPFFPFIEAIFNSLFGVNMWSSRLAILFLAAIGFSAWFFLVRRIFDTATALTSSLLLISLPFVAKWGWYTMGEMPLLSMAMLTSYLFYRYVETNKPLYLFSCALAFVATVWTKQTAFYLAFWFILYLAYDRSLIERLKQKNTWIAIILILAALIPLAAITLWLGDQNLAQSVGTTNAGGASPWAQRWQRLPEHFSNIVNRHTTLPSLVITIIGMALALIKREQKAVFFALFILVTFLFFSYVIHKNERYTIFWIPYFTAFAAMPIYLLRNNKHLRLAYIVLALAVVPFQISKIYAKEPNYATGYLEAADYVLKNSASPTVFVDAYNNGYFTYFMRALDAAKSMYVIRADKLLTSSSIGVRNRLEVHAKSQTDIKDIFDKYGIELIVIESRDQTGLPIYQELRRYLSEGPFELLKSIEVKSTRPPLKDQTLLIYRYTDRKPVSGGILELHLPVVGKTIKVPIRKIGERNSDSK